MKRMAIFGLAFLAPLVGFANSGEWTSNVPPSQVVGPKYGDQLKKGKVTRPTTRPKQGKKKDTGLKSGL
jgi:hypothetical protein